MEQEKWCTPNGTTGTLQPNQVEGAYGFPVADTPAYWRLSRLWTNADHMLDKWWVYSGKVNHKGLMAWYKYLDDTLATMDRPALPAGKS